MNGVSKNLLPNTTSFNFLNKVNMLASQHKSTVISTADPFPKRRTKVSLHRQHNFEGRDYILLPHIYDYWC
jgi:hypothetical protein